MTRGLAGGPGEGLEEDRPGRHGAVADVLPGEARLPVVVPGLRLRVVDAAHGPGHSRLGAGRGPRGPGRRGTREGRCVERGVHPLGVHGERRPEAQARGRGPGARVPDRRVDGRLGPVVEVGQAAQVPLLTHPRRPAPKRLCLRPAPRRLYSRPAATRTGGGASLGHAEVVVEAPAEGRPRRRAREVVGAPLGGPAVVLPDQRRRGPRRVPVPVASLARPRPTRP